MVSGVKDISAFIGSYGLGLGFKLSTHLLKLVWKKPLLFEGAIVLVMVILAQR